MSHFLSSSRPLGADAERVRRIKESSRGRRSRDSREGRDQQQQPDSEGDALSSPWALTSPSSSEFETISDTEIVLNPPPIAAGSQLSGLSRSLSARRDSRPDAESTASTPEVVQQRNRMASYRADYSEVEVERDGDDEYSAVEEDDMRGRGRGRTRMRDDPAIRRSILDDALRSSLATLLSLSAPQASLSPAMSHTSLSSMMNPGFRSPLGVGAVSPGRASLERNAPRTSPFAFSLSVPINHVDHRQEEEEAQQWEEAEQELSEEAIEFYSSGSDEGTQLGPRPSTTRNSTARAIPIPPSTGGSHIRGRSQSDSLPNPSTSFSPLQSRPLALGPSSASPPVWSRRRRRRGQRRSSLSPAPATPEERFRARARGTTDAEDDEIEPDRGFLDLVDATKTFFAMSPRLSAAASSSASASDTISGGNSFASQSQALPGHISPLPQLPATHATSPERDEPKWPPAPPSPASSFPSSDPYLPSSAPTIDLSSSAEAWSSPTAAAAARRTKASDGRDVAKKGGTPAASSGWFAWLNRTIEIKMWHLVGLCTLLVGVGIGAGPLLKDTTKAGRFSFSTVF